MKKLFSRLLVVAAHPDDEILGCGGLLSTLSIQPDHQVRILFVCEGSSCRFSSPHQSEALEALAFRKECSINALSTLNVKDIHFNDYPCGNLNSVPMLSINKLIETHLYEFRPTAVLTHFSSDCNNDHRIVSRSTDMALRPVGGFADTTLLHFEVQSSTDWNFSAPTFGPNFFIPLSEHQMSQKLHAMSLYQGEYSTPLATRGADALKSLAHIRGLQSGHRFAEAYLLVRHSCRF